MGFFQEFTSTRVGGDRRFASMGTEEYDFPHRYEPVVQETRPWFRVLTLVGWSEGTEQDDEKATNGGQTSTVQVGEISRPRTEAHTQS